MIKSKFFRRILAVTLSAAMVLGSTPLIARGAQPITIMQEITDFEELPASIANQEVAVGTLIEELSLPDTLTATLYTEIPAEETDSGAPQQVVPDSGDSEVTTSAAVTADEVQPAGALVVIPVTWEAQPEFNNEEPGSYVFAPELPAEYTLAEEAVAPSITVSVTDTLDAGLLVPEPDELNALNTTVTTTNDVGWTLDTGRLTITSDAGMADWVSNTNGRAARANEVLYVEIESGVTAIAADSFRMCRNLSGIIIPDTVTSIGNFAFWYCPNLQSIDIPNTVTSIGNNAFQGCTTLSGIIIPNGITRINNYVFNGCSSLSNITLPDTLTSIGSFAFYNSSSLRSITIPNTVTSIGEYAFTSCSALESINLPNTITSIGTSTFSGCSSLRSFIIPSSVTSIGAGAFAACINLEAITIPNTIKIIGAEAFAFCTSLTELTIPASVTSIDYRAFAECTNLATVTFEKEIPPATVDEVIFENCTALTNIYVPTANSVVLYKAVENLAPYKDIITGPEDPVQQRTTSLNLMLTNLSYTRAGGGTAPANPTTSNITDTAEGWAWYKTAADGYEANTLVLNGINLSTADQIAIRLQDNVATTIVLADESINTLVSTFSSVIAPSYGIYTSNGNIVIKGTGELHITSGTNISIASTALYTLGEFILERGTLYLKANASNPSYRYALQAKIPEFIPIAYQKENGNYTGLALWSQAAFTYLYRDTYTDDLKLVSSMPIPKAAVNNTAGTSAIDYSGTTVDLTTLTDLFTIDANAGTRTYTIETGGTGAGTIAGDILTITEAGTIQIGLVTVETETHQAGVKVTATLTVNKGTQSAPTGFDKVDTSTNNSSDGKITGLFPKARYEYKKDNGSYTEAAVNSEGEITGLGAGTYVIRYAGSQLFSPGADSAEIVIGQAQAPTFSIVLSPAEYITFDSQPLSYGPVAPRTITINNTGNQPTGVMNVAFSGAYANAFTLSKRTIESIAPNSSDSFTIAPIFGLTPHTYTAPLTVSGDNSISASLQVSFTVTPALSSSKSVTGVTVPAGAGISGTSITAVVENSVARQTIDIAISRGASWKLYSDAACQYEISNKIMSLRVGDNTAYIQVTAENGSKQVYTLTITRQNPVAVTNITVSGSGTISTRGGTMQLTASASPDNAANKAVIWSIQSGSTFADISDNGLLTAKANGSVTVRATAQDGSGIYGEITVAITGQTSNNGGTGNNGGGTGNNGGDTGNSTGNNPSSGADPSAVPTVPVTGGTEKKAAVDSKGNASVSVTDKNITDAIMNAKAEATKKGVNAGEITVSINVSTGGKNADTVTVNLPKTTQQQVISNKIDRMKLTIDRPDIVLGLNNAAITEINRQANADVQLTAAKADSAALGKAAKNAIGSRPVYHFEAKYKGGKGSVTNFGKGAVYVSIPYTPAKNEKVGYLYAVYVDGKGKVSRVPGSAYDSNSQSIIFTTNHFSVYGISYTDPTAQFTDITSHWAKDSIDYMAGRGLLEGSSKTEFSPDTPITREVLVTALGRLAGVITKSYKTSSFSDVKADSTNSAYIEWAYKKGIIQGTGNGKFEADRAVTREEMAAILVNYAKATGYALPSTREAAIYTDASGIGSTYEAAVKALQQAGILMGSTGNRFNPKGSTTRAEAANMLFRYIKLTIDSDTAQGWAKNDAGESLYYQDGRKLTGFKELAVNGSIHTFYFTKDGILAVGKWLQIDGKWYYFNADGTLAKNTVIDGYQVDEKGVRKAN